VIFRLFFLFGLILMLLSLAGAFLMASVGDTAAAEFYAVSSIKLLFGACVVGGVLQLPFLFRDL
jgi:hypothetical protein